MKTEVKFLCCVTQMDQLGHHYSLSWAWRSWVYCCNVPETLWGAGILSPGLSAPAFWLPAVIKVQEIPWPTWKLFSVVHVLCHLLQWVRSYWEGICNLPKGSVQEITTTHKYLFRKGIPFLPQSHRRRTWDPVNSHLTATPAHYHMHKEGWLSTWRYSSRKTGPGRLSVIHTVKNPHALKPEHAPAEVQVSVLHGQEGQRKWFCIFPWCEPHITWYLPRPVATFLLPWSPHHWVVCAPLTVAEAMELAWMFLW